MGSYTLRPAANAGPNDGAVVGAASAWDAVNDATPDDDTSYCQHTTGGDEERFNASAASILAIPAQERIDSIAVHWRWKPGGGIGTFQSKGIIELSGTTVRSGQNPGSGGGIYLNDSWTKVGHPAGDRNILRRHLKDGGLAFGYEMDDIQIDLPRPRLTQVYAVVNTSAQSKLLAIKRYLAESIGDVVVPWDSPNTIRSVGSYGSKLKAWHEIVNWPAAFIIIGGETKERRQTQRKEGTATFLIPTVVKTDDPVDRFMTLYEAIEESIESDPSLDGLALDAVIRGFTALTTSQTIAGDFHVADIFVDVQYRHERGDA